MKPEPFQKIGDRFTLKYRRPILLDAGRRTIKAVALSRKIASAAPSNIRTKYVEVVDINAADAASGGSSSSSSESEEAVLRTRTLRGTVRPSNSSPTKKKPTIGHLKATKRHGGSGGGKPRRHRRRGSSSDLSASEDSGSGSSSDLSDVGRYTGREAWREVVHDPPLLSRMDDAIATGRLVPRDGRSLSASAGAGDRHHRHRSSGHNRHRSGRRSRSMSRSPSPDIPSGGVAPDTHCTVCHAPRPRGRTDFCDSCGSQLAPLLRSAPHGGHSATSRMQPPQQPLQTMMGSATMPFGVGTGMTPPTMMQPQPGFYGNTAYTGGQVMAPGGFQGAMTPPGGATMGGATMGGSWTQPVASPAGPVAGMTMHATHPLDVTGAAAAMQAQQQMPSQQQQQHQQQWHSQHGSFWEAATQPAGDTIGMTRDTLLEIADEHATGGGGGGGAGGGAKFGGRSKRGTVGTQTTGLYFPSTAQMKNNRVRWAALLLFTIGVAPSPPHVLMNALDFPPSQCAL